jgi:hypothetical protein
VKEHRPCDSSGFPLALNWSIVLRNQAEGKPLTLGAYILPNEQTNKQQDNKNNEKQKKEQRRKRS